MPAAPRIHLVPDLRNNFSSIPGKAHEFGHLDGITMNSKKAKA